MEKTRREFIGGAAVAGAAASVFAGLGMRSQAQADEAQQVEWASEADVVVVGCGAGGTGAVLTAHQAGNSVIVVEKLDWLGGTMRRSGGGIAAANTCVQRALGVEDNVDDFYGYITACGEGLVDKDMLRVFADRSGADFDWYVQEIAGQTEADWHFANGQEGLEMSLHPGLNLGDTPMYWDRYGYTPVPRCYWFEANPDDIDETRMYQPTRLVGDPDETDPRGGTGLWKPAQDYIDASDIEVHTGTSLSSLVCNAAGEVIGVRCKVVETGEDVWFKANKGVVLATGGFERNEQMLFDYNLYGWSMGSSAANSFNDESTNLAIMLGWALPEQEDGAGILAAQAIGAKVARMVAGPWRGGLVTDVNAQVINIAGAPIPRLYASSYCVSGKYGLMYPNCGLHNMWNISFGRVAAESIDALAPVEDGTPVIVGGSGCEPVADFEPVVPSLYRIAEFASVEHADPADAKDGTYTGTGVGTGGPINVTIEVKDGVISVLEIGPNNEIAGTHMMAAEAIDDGTFAAQIEAAQSAEIDGLSGATFTTYAIKVAVQDAIDKAAQ